MTVAVRSQSPMIYGTRVDVAQAEVSGNQQGPERGPYWTCIDKTSVLLQGGPPEPSLQDLFGALNTWVTGELGVVGPLQDVRPQALRNKQAAMGTGTGTWLILQCCLYPLLHLPGESGHQTGSREDGVRIRGGLFSCHELARQGIWFDIAGARLIGEREVEPGEE